MHFQERLAAASDKSALKAGVVGAFLITVISNVAANFGVFGGTDNAEISNSYPTYVTPDGRTFAVWGLIYTGLLALVVVQYRSNDIQLETLLARRCPLTQFDVRERLIAVFVLNALWLPIFNFQRFAAALLVIVMYFGMLLSLMGDLNPLNTSGLTQYLTLSAPIAANASWLLVATFANLFILAGSLGWRDQYGVAGRPQAVEAIAVLVTVVAIIIAITPSDPLWPAVAAWALMGIYRMQTNSDIESFPQNARNDRLATIAQVCSFVCMAAVVVATYIMTTRPPRQQCTQVFID